MEIEGVALVTGASRGIGRAVALELARRGFEVVATMRDPRAGVDLAKEAGQAGNRLRVERLDVEQPDSIRIPEGLRVLVNNAGVEGPYLPVEEAPLALWRRIFETNVFGLVEVTRRAIPALRASGGGVVCNLTSPARERRRGRLQPDLGVVAVSDALLRGLPRQQGGGAGAR